MDELHGSGHVSSRELYAALGSMREESASARRAAIADINSAINATEIRVSGRLDRLEEAVSQHEELIQQMRGARSLLTLVFGASVLTTVVGLVTLWALLK